MKNAILFHGGYSTPHDYWFPSIAAFLQSHGYTVWSPQLPEADHPTLDVWRSYALSNGTYDTDTIIIAHSLGCPLTLSILEHIFVPIRKTIFVAGFAVPRNHPGIHEEPMLQKTYDWGKIRSYCSDFTFINSKNDPWGCDDTQGRYMYEHLGGTLLIQEHEGHMGSHTYGQPYETFPLLEEILSD
jgi:predicted alpha/beta hydrolase family esterase